MMIGLIRIGQAKRQMPRKIDCDIVDTCFFSLDSIVALLLRVPPQYGIKTAVAALEMYRTAIQSPKTTAMPISHNQRLHEK